MVQHQNSRTYATSSTSAPPENLTSFADPDRKSGHPLYYHLAHPPTPFSAHVPAFALSFLPDAPSRPDSCTVIGWLPAASEVDEQEAGLNDFKENPNFRRVLHDGIASGLAADVDEIQRNGALQLGQGWMHIHDERNVPALSRIGDPDDIIASVLVEGGKIIPDTYQPMPAYRMCTSDGVLQLTEGLSAHLKALLERRAKDESP